MTQRALHQYPLPDEEAREKATEFENVDVFSDYFLRQALWQGALKDRVVQPEEAYQAWREAKRAFDLGTFGLDEYASEEETLKRWIRPLLKVLGYHLQGKVEIVTDKGLLASSHHHAFDGVPEGAAHRVLIQTEAWGTDLDAAREGLTGRATPTNQVLRCLRHADSGARWAILTNGQELRLLGADLRLPPRAYLSFDLLRIFRDGTARDTGFLLLHGLLSATRLRPQGDEHKSTLDEVLDESRELAASVKGALGEVVPHLLEELVRDLRTHNPDFRDEADADTAFKTGLILFYRLLFVAYAESKGLLPVGNHIYRSSYSLDALRTRVEERHRQGTAWPIDRHTLWPQLQALFRFLRQDYSTPDLPLMPLGGGLFSEEEAPWLDRVRLPDPPVARLIHGLSVARIRRGRARRAESEERINYADLDIGELGSIYESLLEYKPSIAAEPMAVILSGGEEQTLPERFAADHPRKIGENGAPVAIQPGTFYLATWNGLRKGSGTYYTPRAFTEFQVRNALEPLAQKAVADARPEDILDLKICDPAMGSGAFLVAAVEYLGERLQDACVQASKASHYERTVARLRGEDDESPKHGDAVALALLEVVHRARAATLDEQDLQSLKRLAAEHCIYGVDLNPMAVQLARVSLWLTTASRDRALTFLDDRLVPGDSLIGARLDDLSASKLPLPIAQATLNGLRGNKRQQVEKALKEQAKQRTFATYENIRSGLEALARERAAIQDQPTVTVQDAAWKAEQLKRLRTDSSAAHHRLERLARLWASLWFWDDKSAVPHLADEQGVPPFPNRGQWERIAKHVIHPDSVQLDDEEERILGVGDRLGGARRYHAWELTFPEVFIDHDGFDVIVGNPPWEAVRQSEKEWGALYNPSIGKGMTGRQFDEWRDQLFREHPELEAHHRAFLANQRTLGDYFGNSPHYPLPSGRDVNTYKFFLQRGLALLRPNGRLAQIIPSGLGTGADAAPLRKHILDNTRIDYWIDFENATKIFPIHSSFRFVLLLAAKGSGTTTLRCRFYEREMESLRRFPNDGLLSVPRELLQKLSSEGEELTEFRSQEEIRPLAKLFEAGPLLGENLVGTWNVKYRREFDTSKDRDFFNEEGRGLPLLKGESFYQLDGGLYSCTYWMEEHVARRVLLDKTDNSREAEILRESLGERLPFEVPRVVFRDIARATDRRTVIAAVVAPGVVVAGDTAPQLYLIPNALPLRYYLTGVMCSFVFDYAIRRKVSSHVKKFHVYGVPVPRIAFDAIVEDGTGAKIAKLSRRIHARWAALKPDDPEGAHAKPPADVAAMEAAMNAYTAALYGLDEDAFRVVLGTFSLVDEVLKEVTFEAFAGALRGEDAERVAWEALVRHLPSGATGDQMPPWLTVPWRGWEE